MSNELDDRRHAFLQGNISKKEYNEKLWAFHQRLFDYPYFLERSNVQSIEIKESGVYLRLRDPDLIFQCTPHDQRHIAFTSLNFGGYEAEDLKVVLKLSEPCHTIIDVGANTGFYSMALAKNCPDATVYAFEPIPAIYRQLVGNIRLNKIDNIKALPVGLSNVKDCIPFYYDINVPGATSSAPLGEEFGPTEVLSCAVNTLDQIFVNSGVIPDFIKCDVEGAELMVFQGAIKTLTEAKPIVFTEMVRKWTKRFDYTPNDTISLFDSLGYKCFVVRGGELQPFPEMTNDVMESNFFFIPD